MPDMKRQSENVVTLWENIVEKSPIKPEKFESMRAGKRPILSESRP